MRKKAKIPFSILLLLVVGLGITFVFPGTFYVPVLASLDAGDSWASPVNFTISSDPSTHCYTSTSDRAIAVDLQGNLHVVVYGYSNTSAGNEEIFYWTNSSGSWTWQNVSEVNTTGVHQWRPVLALDSNGVVHVVWSGKVSAAGPYYDIFYANNFGGSWSTPYNVTKSPNLDERDSSIAFDSTGMLHVAYFESLEDTVSYINRSSAGIWSTPVNLTTSPYTFTDIGPTFGMALGPDSNDNIYVAFGAQNNSPYSDVFVLNNSAGSWSIPYNVSQNSLMTDFGPSMSIDSVNTIHLAYESGNATDRWVTYRSFSGGAWSSPVAVNGSTGTISFLSLASDLDNKVHVAFSQSNGTDYEIYYANNTAGSFGAPVNITKTIINEMRPQLILDRQGYAHIVYNFEGSPFFDQYVRSTEPVGPAAPPSDLTLLLIVGGAVGAVAVIAALAVFLIRRRG